MAAPDILNVSRLSAGLYVEFLGPTEDGPGVTMVGVGDRVPQCDRLWYGHPGVIREPVPQHVQVTWVGLEDATASTMDGFSCDDRGCYPGLGILCAEEYETRRSRILNGKSPVG
jgi:hypothetical protein